MSSLNAALLAAHAQDNKHALVTLYQQAGDAAETTDAACFFLTHAYIYALETNHPAAPDLHNRLKAHNRV